MKSNTRMLVAAAVAALIVGALDLCVVRAYWDSAGISFTRIGQSVARGWYGDASFAGGTKTALVGTLTHFGIMFAFMLTYLLAAQRTAFMRKYPAISAIAYGLGTFVVMNFVVVPLSAIGFHAPKLMGAIRTLIPHVLFVGPAIALVAARFAAASRTDLTPNS